MGYSEKDIFVGKDVHGNEICAGFLFTPDIAQGTQLAQATLDLWLQRAYPAGQSTLDHFVDDDDTPLQLHTPDMGPVTGWRSEAGNLDIQGNEVANVGTGAPHLYSFESGVADGVVAVDVYAHNYLYTDRWVGGGVLFRFVDTSNYWAFYMACTHGTHKTYLEKVVAGSPTTVWEGAGYKDTWKRLRVEFDGNSIVAYLAGVEQYSGSDSAHNSATEHGLYCTINKIYQDSLWARLDDFEFIPVGTPSPNIEVACHDVDNAPDFSAGALPGDRVLTTAKVSLGDISSWTEGDWNATVDIKDAIQEILDRSGWSAENGLAVILKPTDACGNGELLRIVSYEESSVHAAQLTLTS